MNSGPKEKAFDCMNWLRETRDQIYEETKDMTREERRAWYSQRPTDPILAKLFDRWKTPEGKRSPDEAIGGRRTRPHR